MKHTQSELRSVSIEIVDCRMAGGVDVADVFYYEIGSPANVTLAWTRPAMEKFHALAGELLAAPMPPACDALPYLEDERKCEVHCPPSQRSLFRQP